MELWLPYHHDTLDMLFHLECSFLGFGSPGSQCKESSKAVRVFLMKHWTSICHCQGTFWAWLSNYKRAKTSEWKLEYTKSNEAQEKNLGGNRIKGYCLGLSQL